MNQCNSSMSTTINCFFLIKLKSETEASKTSTQWILPITKSIVRAPLLVVHALIWAIQQALVIYLPAIFIVPTVWEHGKLKAEQGIEVMKCLLLFLSY